MARKCITLYKLDLQAFFVSYTTTYFIKHYEKKFLLHRHQPQYSHSWYDKVFVKTRESGIFSDAVLIATVAGPQKMYF